MKQVQILGLRGWALGMLAALGLVLGASGCGGGSSGGGTAQPGPQAVGEEQDLPDPGADQLFPGDRVTVLFHGPPNPPQPFTEAIRSGGTISPPLLPNPVVAAGKTLGQLEQELHDLYVPAYFTTLTITVKSEERYFFVGGYVAAPGMLPYRSGMTLTKGIKAAGDVTIWAGKKVTITRADRQTQECDLGDILDDPKLDPPLYPNDSIYVHKRGPFSP